MNKFIDRSKLSSKQLEELDNAEKAAVSIALDRAVERAKREWHAAIAAEAERVAHEEEERLAREAAELQAKEEVSRGKHRGGWRGGLRCCGAARSWGAKSLDLFLRAADLRALLVLHVSQHTKFWRC